MTNGTRAVTVGIAAVLALAFTVGCEEAQTEGVAADVTIHRPGASTAPGGFLWKPVSESNGKLVILFPSSMNGQIKSAEVHSAMPPSTDTLKEAGWYAGNHNGNREHWRFSQGGAAYGDGVYGVAVLNDGSYQAWFIPSGGSRTTY